MTDFKKKQLLIWQQSLSSNDRTTIIETLSEIHAEGRVAILPDLLTLYQQTDDEFIQRKISDILCYLKDKEAHSFLLQAIENPSYQPVLPLLLTAIWMNQLEASAQLPTLLKLSLSDDYELAFEAFTVIDHLHAPIATWSQAATIIEQLALEFPHAQLLTLVQQCLHEKLAAQADAYSSNTYE